MSCVAGYVFAVRVAYRSRWWLMQSFYTLAPA
jgi:hypothetical protein